MLSNVSILILDGVFPINIERYFHSVYHKCNHHATQEIERERSLNIKEKEQKSMSLEEIARRKKELTLDHDRTILDDDCDLGGVCLAKSFTRGGMASGSSFHGRSQDINVKDMMQINVSGDSGERPTPEVDSAGDLDGGVPSSNKPSTRGKQFDKMTQVTAKIRSEQGALADIEATLKTRKDDSEKALLELQGKSSECINDLEVEKSMLEKRLKFVKMVLQCDGMGETELKKSIEELVSAVDEDLTKANRATQMQRAPPCPSFAQLSLVQIVQDGFQNYWTCDTSQKLTLGICIGLDFVLIFLFLFCFYAMNLFLYICFWFLPFVSIPFQSYLGPF